jgi:twitching motility protein PilT
VNTTTREIVPAVEILLTNSAVQKMVTNDEADQLLGLMELNTGDGMQSFDQSLVNRVAENRITREEAIAHATNPDTLRMGFQGVILNESRRILQSRK